MEVSFSKEEVFIALNYLNDDKGPRPFLAGTLKDDVLKMFKDFFETGKFVQSLTTTFIVLVLKKSGAKDLKDFRPISQVNSLYKLISKVLANILKKVMKALSYYSK